MKHFLILALIVWASAATAQEVEFTPGPTLLCLSGNEGNPAAWQFCAGKASEACMDANEGGFTTVGMVACTDREYQFWEARMNAAYGAALANAQAIDAENAEYGSRAPSLTEHLIDMQLAWIAYRDRLCEFERAKWGGGSGGGPAVVGCLMYQTARQSAILEAGVGLE